MQTIRPIVLCVSCAIFILFTLLQINDANQYGNFDAWSWIILYGIPIAVSGLALRASIREKWAFSLLGFYSGCLFFRLQDNRGNFHFDRLNPLNYWGEPGSLLVQQANDCGGIMILCLWSVVLLVFKEKPS